MCDYVKKYMAKPKGKAMKMWHHMNERVDKQKHYRVKGIQVRISREEFMEWAIPEIERFMVTHPTQTPSLDRKDPDKHYEQGNIQIISREGNFLRCGYISKWFALDKPQSDEQVFSKALAMVECIMEQSGRNITDFMKYADTTMKDVATTDHQRRSSDANGTGSEVGCSCPNQKNMLYVPPEEMWIVGYDSNGLRLTPPKGV